MHESIIKYLEKQNKIKIENRRQFLLDNDICERVYNPIEDGEYNDEYPFRDCDTNKWYKKEPIDITDDEFNLIQKAYNEAHTSEKSESNSIATFFFVFGWITIIAGLIESLSAASDDKGESFTFSIFVIHLAITLVLSMLYFGFGEVIKLLNDIKNK
jgi:hypothetical protein